jgi:hypothetical protein
VNDSAGAFAVLFISSLTVIFLSGGTVSVGAGVGAVLSTLLCKIDWLGAHAVAPRARDTKVLRIVIRILHHFYNTLSGVSNAQ